MTPPRTRLHRVLGVAAWTLAVLAVAAGDVPRSAAGAVNVIELARAVEREEDHVTALELARWLRDRQPGLRVIDVRSDTAYAEYHIPGAEHASLSRLARAQLGRDETIVLYSEGGTHAAQGWFLLRARGVRRVFFLRGGIYEWVEQVMRPVLPASGGAAAEEVARLSRWFGGLPTRGIGGQPAGDTLRPPSVGGKGSGGGRPRALRRLGC